jgi:4-oxalocrotonate tautomerase
MEEYRKARERQSRRKGLQHGRAVFLAITGAISFSREHPMPHVQITWVEGRTPDQKRKIAEQITQTLEQEGRAKKANIHVAFLDVPATNYAEAGVTVADQKRTP